MPNYAGTKEANLPTPAVLAVTDFVRVVIGAISAKISLTNFASQISPLIAASVSKNKIRSVTANSAILITDNSIFADSSSGNISLTLPSPASAFDTINSLSNSFTIAQQVHGGNSVTILPNSSEFIYDGAAQTSIVLSSGSSVTVETDGTNWTIVSA